MSTDTTGGPGALSGPSREQLLTQTFVALADTLVDDYDVVDLLDRLTSACVSMLHVSAAGILLDDQRGHLAVVASSTEETRLLEVFQLQNDEGPCLECVRSGATVVSEDLDADRGRWPVFARAALDAGFASVASFPLRLRAQTVGALNMFTSVRGALPTPDHVLAQALADAATIAILQQRSAHRLSQLTEQLQHALNSRVALEQAKGILAERHGLSMETAFEALRAHARNHGLKLTDVALAVAQAPPNIEVVPIAASRRDQTPR